MPSFPVGRAHLQRCWLSPTSLRRSKRFRMRARQNGWPRRVDRLPVDLIYLCERVRTTTGPKSKRSAIETRRGGPLNPRARARPPPRQFTTDNALRVFASRSRCKNSVGLNAVGAEGSATAHGNFSRDRALERRRRTGGRLWASPWSPLRAWKLRGRGQWTSFRADRAGVWRRRAKRMRGMADACMDLEVVSGDRVARHGPWAHFGESWRTNVRRLLRQ